MQIALFTRTARFIYGENFIAPLARDIGINVRNVRRWLNGEKPIPPGINARMADLVRAHATDLIDALNRDAFPQGGPLAAESPGSAIPARAAVAAGK